MRLPRGWIVEKVLGSGPLYKVSTWNPLFQRLACECCSGDFFVGPFVFHKEFVK